MRRLLATITGVAALAVTMSAFSLLGIDAEAGTAATTVTANAATARTSKAATRATARTRALFSDIGSNSPGCTIAVARNGNVVFAEVFGSANLSTQARMTTATIVDIGSTSKQFTATAIALLVNRNQLRLSDVVSDHLDGLPKWSDGVTIDQLVHHTSGIPDYVDLLSDEGFDDTDRTTDADALAALADADQLEFPAGKKFFVLKLQLLPPGPNRPERHGSRHRNVHQTGDLQAVETQRSHGRVGEPRR